MTVEVDGDHAALLARLRRRRASPCGATGELLHVDVADAAAYDVVRDAVAELGLGLVRMERERHRMTEIFTDARRRRETSMSEPSRPTPTGAIHDIGYRHYDGPRLGPSTSGARSSSRPCAAPTASAARPGRRSMPLLLLALLVLPALAIGIVTGYFGFGSLPIGYTEYVFGFQVAVTIFVGCAVAGGDVARPPVPGGVVVLLPAAEPPAVRPGEVRRRWRPRCSS